MAMTNSFRLPLVLVVVVIVSSTAQERTDSVSDRGCHSDELAPDVAEWSDADEDDVTVHMSLSNQTTCESLRSCKMADSDEPSVKQLVPLALQQSRGLRLLMMTPDQVDVYRVDKNGFLHCRVALGIPRLPLSTAAAAAAAGAEAGALNATPLVVVVVPRDQLRDPGSYYFIGVNSSQPAGLDGTECADGLRLNVTVRPSDCHDTSWTNGSARYHPVTATACSGLGRCVAQRYRDNMYRCNCCNASSGLYCGASNTYNSNTTDNSTTSTTTTSTTPDYHNSKVDMEMMPATYSYHDDDTDDSIGINVTCSLSCRNNGSCFMATDLPWCECADGWTGALCENEVINSVDRTTCSPETCVNGICALPSDESSPPEGSTALRCYCIPGYGGDHCELSYSTCLSGPCLNGGLCIETMLRGHICECMEGYAGDNCEFVKEVNNCQPNPCQHICLDYGQYYVCECNPGLTGVRCDEDIDDCVTNPCHNGGLCIDELAGYQCQCATGYHGRHCEQTNFTTDWSALFMTSRQVGGATRHLHSWTMALCTLVGALLIALLVITVLYCKVHGLYHWVVICRRKGYDTQTDELFPSETTRVHQSAGSRPCLSWSIRALIQAAAETVRLNHGGRASPSSSLPSSTSPKVPLVTDVRDKGATEQSTVAKKPPQRPGRRRSRHDDIAETSVTIEV